LGNGGIPSGDPRRRSAGVLTLSAVEWERTQFLLPIKLSGPFQEARFQQTRGPLGQSAGVKAVLAPGAELWGTAALQGRMVQRRKKVQDE